MLHIRSSGREFGDSAFSFKPRSVVAACFGITNLIYTHASNCSSILLTQPATKAPYGSLSGSEKLLDEVARHAVEEEAQHDEQQQDQHDLDD